MITITVEERSLMNEIVKSTLVCSVAMIDEEGMPYVIPMNFGFEEDIIYLHSGQEGKSKSSLEKNPNVCISFFSPPKLIHQHPEVACSYRVKGSSVICYGKVQFIEDLEQKSKALDIIMKQYSNNSFTYSVPALRNVKAWKIEIEEITTKIFGAHNPKSPHYRGEDFSQYY